MAADPSPAPSPGPAKKRALARIASTPRGLYNRGRRWLLRGHRWLFPALALIPVVGLIWLTLALLPSLLVPPVSNQLGLEAREKLLVEERRTMVALLVAAGGGLSLWYTAQRHRLDREAADRDRQRDRDTEILNREAADLNRDANRTDRYSKAVEQLGSAKSSVQIGGIYALERIAMDSERDRITIIDVLAAFVRETCASGTVRTSNGGGQQSIRAAGQRELLATTMAALSALARITSDTRDQYDLRRVDLSDADLSGLNLRHARLRGASLSSTILTAADLSGAELDGADFTGAVLYGTNLNGGNLAGAIFVDTRMSAARLVNATLVGADLISVKAKSSDFTDADLTGATLTGCVLTDVTMVRANLTDADFSGTSLRYVDLSGALGVDSITNAARSVGVKLTDAQPDTLRDQPL